MLHNGNLTMICSTKRQSVHYLTNLALECLCLKNKISGRKVFFDTTMPTKTKMISGCNGHYIRLMNYLCVQELKMLFIFRRSETTQIIKRMRVSLLHGYALDNWVYILYSAHSSYNY
jgi:hypothetical protein